MKRFCTLWNWNQGNRWMLLLLLPSIACVVEGKASIKVDKQCYELNEDYKVSFVNENRQVDDWIGFFPASESNDDLRNYEIWLRTCGSKQCQRSIQEDTVTVSAALPPGMWKVVLAREGDEPYDAYAISDEFEVREVCGSDKVFPEEDDGESNKTQNEIALSAMQSAKASIEGLIREDSDLAPKFLRMIFHDCVGGCDGCLDLDNPENFGLQKPVNALRDVVEEHANSQTGLSRADIWALAGFVACDVSQARIDFSLDHFRWWGRVDCENTGQVCRNKDGDEVACSETKGPHHEFPSLNILTDDLYEFFENEFGFNEEDVVVIMGAHTIGRLAKVNSGVSGPNGWVPTRQTLDNAYYVELVGGDSMDDPIEVLVNDAPAWARVIERNSGDTFPDRHFWASNMNGVDINMLNADISLIRRLDMDEDGRVLCSFEDNRSNGNSFPVCPHVESALRHAAKFKHDELEWLRDFRDVLSRMMTSGYSTRSCDDTICKLAF